MFNNRFLENTTLNSGYGCFHPETLQIYVSGNINEDGLNNDQKQILRHEKLHYLHFTSKTLGINFIRNNLKELQNISTWKNESMTYSQINSIHSAVVKNNKLKSILTVPSYYFEQGKRYGERRNPDSWKITTSVGTFFKENGQLSDQNFIMQRYYAGDPYNPNDLVARVSIGTKYLYEHLIKFIDMMTDMEIHGAEEAYTLHYERAYYGPLLPYSALALLCARYNVIGLNAFILSAIISHIALMVPLKWNKQTKGLRNYVEKIIRKEIGRQNYSFRMCHPSIVVYGLLNKAIEKGATKINFLSFFDDKNNYEKLNEYIDDLSGSLGFSTDDLFTMCEEELKRLRRTSVKDIVLLNLKEKLIKEIENNLVIQKENFGKYIIKPHETIYDPFISLDNTVFPGNLTSHDEREHLLYLIDQRDEMLRFSIERNLID